MSGCHIAHESHHPDWDSPVASVSGPVNPGPGLRKVFSYVSAFPLQDGSTDSADVVRLTGGEYTVVCTTAASGDAGGDVLVEVYFPP